MAVLEGVVVHVVSSRTGEKLVEYDDPDPEAAAAEREVKKFIEVVSDEEFYIRVKLKAGFSYHRATGVRIDLRIDGTAVDTSCHEPIGTSSIRRKRLLNDVSYDIRDVPVKRGNDWVDIAFAFGKAEPDEDVHLEPEAFQQQFSQVGTIVVNVGRVTPKQLKHPKERNLPEPCPVGQIDRKLILQNVSNTFKTGNESKRPLAPRRIRTERLAGKLGEKSRFVFNYRSHRALQYIGCIPTTPPPVPLSECPPAELSELRKEETSKLRVENEALRRQIQELTQANHALTEEADQAKDIKARMCGLQSALEDLGSVTKQESQTPRVKRERSEGNGTPAQVAKRSKPSYVVLDD